MRRLYVLLIAVMLFSPVISAANVFKCKNSAGVLIYQETPCAQETQAVSSWGAKSAGNYHDFSRPGFQGIAWGVDENAILAKFGSVITRLPRPDTYFNAHATLEIEKYNVGNVVMKTAFQMSNATNKLSGVLLQKFQSPAQGQSLNKEFDTLLALMRQKLGNPARLREYTYRWVVGDTAVELDYLYQANVMENLTIHYKPM